MMNPNECSISAIRVTGLFGLYTYRLPHDGSLPSAAILYGDNGVGKSTILRLAFHLLSASGNRGHRTALAKTEFRELEIDLSNGVTLKAERTSKASPKLIMLSVLKSERTLAVWPYQPGQTDTDKLLEAGYIEVIRASDGMRTLRRTKRTSFKRRKDPDVPHGELAYLEVLKEYSPRTFILNAERRLDSDSIPDSLDEVEFRRQMRSDEKGRIRDVASRAREIALSQSLAAASKWVQGKAVQGANQGSTNVHSVYTNVLRQLSKSTEARGEATSPRFQ
jgi:hypothetical protein